MKEYLQFLSRGFKLFFWALLVISVIFAGLTVYMWIDGVEIETFEFGQVSMAVNTETVDNQAEGIGIFMVIDFLDITAFLIFATFACKKLSDIFKPFTEVTPCFDKVSKDLSMLGNITVIYGFANYGLTFLYNHLYDQFLEKFGHLFTNEYITSFKLKTGADFSNYVIWLFISIVLYALAYTFDAVIKQKSAPKSLND